MMKKALLLGALSLLLSTLAFAASDDKPSFGWLGVTLAVEKVVLDDDTGYDSGVRILSTIPDSPAHYAGLKKGDIIVGVDNGDAEDLKALKGYLASKRPGDRVWIDVLRDNSEMTVTVDLGQWPTSEEKQVNKYAPSSHQKGIKHKKPCKGEETEKGYIGVNLQTLTPGLRDYFGAEKETGVLVSKVLKDKPAEHAGLKAGDVIIEVNGDTINSIKALQKSIGEMKEGDEARLVILRDQSEMVVPVYVGVKKIKKCSSLKHFEFSDIFDLLD
ncbi:PDZ domain-containing protein [Acidobacteriota bacterium]